MARIEPKTLTLRGASITIRTAEPDDAEALIEHMTDHDATAPFPVTMRDERNFDPANRREVIGKLMANPAALLLLAVASACDEPGGVVGALAFDPAPKRRLAHHGNFGISVHSQWRGRGIGTALINTLLQWATEHPTIEKVCLEVVAANDQAVVLYRRLGFVEEGRRVRAIKFGPGDYSDDILMARFVKPPS